MSVFFWQEHRDDDVIDQASLTEWVLLGGGSGCSQVIQRALLSAAPWPLTKTKSGSISVRT